MIAPARPPRTIVAQTTISRRSLIAIAASAALALLAAACAAPASPRGWAPPEPVAAAEQDYVLVPHEDELFALRGEERFPQWQFPPSERQLYLVSQERREEIVALIEDLDLPEAQQSNLFELADALRVRGDSAGQLKDALESAVPEGDARAPIDDAIDNARRLENEALDDVDGIYGQVGVSEDGDTVFVPTHGGWLFALETATGDMIWTRDFHDPMIGGVAVDGDTLFFGTRAGEAFAVDATSGEEIWRFDTDDGVWATPTLTDDAVYLTSMGGHVYKLDRDGNEQWTFDNTGAGIASQVTVDDGTVYVGSFDKKLYAINDEDGTQRWSFEGGNWFWSQPVVANGLVYAGNLDAKVYAVRADSGERAWRFDAESPVRSSPVLAGGGLIVAARDGDVFKLDPETGEATGGTFALGSRMESDLVTDGDGDTVYAAPREATLFIVDASGNLTGSSVTLPD